MKKLTVKLALAGVLACFAVAGFAQPRAIGGRLGYGVDFSYQHTVGKNMINVEAGLPGFLGVSAAATHDWIFPIKSWEEEGTWNWFAGVGAGLGFSFPHEGNPGYFNLGVAGRIGVEYNFWFPLQLSLDWRPIVGPYFGDGIVGFHTYALYEGGIALGVRYLF